jgi:hypothetical protein
MPVAPFRPRIEVETTGSLRFLENPCAHALLFSDPGGIAYARPIFGVSMLPSAFTTASASTLRLSRLNDTACTLAVYASQHGSPHDHARLASGCWPALPGGIGYPQGSIEGFQLFFTTSSFPRLCLTHSRLL